jgi:hypothetical protein
VIFDTRDKNGQGIAISTREEGTIGLDLSDGKTTDGWTCDPGSLKRGQWHHVVIIVDGGPKIITFVLDGVLCDGGSARQHGWRRFNAALGDVNALGKAKVAPSFGGELKCLRIYDRYLRTSEAVGNFRAR